MKWSLNPLKWFRKEKRSYAGASSSRLYYSWLKPTTSANAEIQPNLAVLRARSRELARNNDYAKKYLAMLKNNVVGANGIILQSKVRNDNGEGFDAPANQAIEASWKEWGKSGNCTVDGTLSWLDVQRVFLETVARDGECLIRMVKAWNNRWGFALQLLEADYLDEAYDDRAANIRMGIEVDSWGRPAAYHLLASHPGDNWQQKPGVKVYQRFPWAEIIHAFVPERPQQLRGVPWFHAAMTRMNHIGEYEEAELVAARVGAAQMGFYTKSAEVLANVRGNDKDSAGNLIKSAEPGTFNELPPGVNFSPFTPNHPTDAYPDFIKASLRGIAAGLNVSYNSLANDLESVNYSSYRAGSLEERDNWRALQTWVIQALFRRIYSEWLYWSMINRALVFPMAKFDKFNSPVWRPRGWDWVDPEKDVEASRKEISSGFKTRTEVAAERGEELEDIYQQLAEEEKLAAKYGLDLKLEKEAAPSREPAPVEGKA